MCREKKKLWNEIIFEISKQYFIIGGRLNASGKSEAAVTARIKFENFRECGRSCFMEESFR